jgi:hypothetical protein
VSKDTAIQWCDSTVNPVMGCGGCELWSADHRGRRTCYAGVLHQRYGRQKGYARDFLAPEVFPGRVELATRWSDLRGKPREARPGKPGGGKPGGGKPGGGKPDGPRYRALGNSIAVPVLRWLGQRIVMVDDILREHAERHTAVTS